MKKVYDCKGKFFKNSDHFYVAVNLTKIRNEKGEKDKFIINTFFNISTKKQQAIVGILKRKSKNKESLSGMEQNFTKPVVFELEEIKKYKESLELDLKSSEEIVFFIFHDEAFKEKKLECFRRILDEIPLGNGDITKTVQQKTSECLECDSKNGFFMPETSGGGILVGI